MRAASWLEVERILSDALQLEPAERSAFLDAACGGDDALRHEVESLLDADARAGSFLAAPPVHGQRERELLTGALPRPGDRVGSYRILRELGRGGVSVVFLAQRDDGRFDKKVSVKVLQIERINPSALDRFRNECSILASFEHPNIARLYDAGHLANGAPYVVMEFVEGEHISTFCDRRRLTVEQRIELFCRVCRALHYTHQRLVVHRDVKPGNILVTDDGTPKLLDFGIAKLLTPKASAGLQEPTAPWLRPMTPTYASPEQILGEPTTTASDVYSLGVLLYRLLTGRVPYELVGPTLVELNRFIEAIEYPKKPSEAAGEMTSKPEGSAPDKEAGGPPSSPQHLRRRLAGDLDSIILMAMRREPEQRYGSAARLAEDLERHLAGKPVRARAGSRFYYGAKLLRRHRVALAVVAGFTALLVSFGVSTFNQNEQVRRERDKLERTSSFFYDLFQTSNPEQAGNRALPAREILDRGAALATSELGDTPHAYATMVDILGSLYAALGLFEEAQPLIEEGLSLRRQMLGPRHPDVATSLFNLAEVHHGRGDWREAADLHRESLQLRRRTLEAGHPLIADSHEALGTVLGSLGAYDEAVVHLEKSLAIRRARRGSPHRKVGQSLNSLAHVYVRAGNLDAAEPLLIEALALQRRLLPRNHPDLAFTLDDLGIVARDRGRLADAEVLFREALEILRRVHGDDHPRIATLLNELAMAIEAQNRFSEAEQLFRQALERFRQAYGEEHPDTLTVMSNLAHVLTLQGDDSTAEALYRRVWRGRLKTLGEDHPLIGQVCYSLAVLLHRRGDLEQAEQLYRKASENAERLLPSTHPARAFGKVGLGEILIARGDGAAAETLLRRALTILETSLPPEHWRIAHARSVLGGALVAQERFAEAGPILAANHPLLVRLRGEEDPRTVQAAEWLAAARRALSPDVPRPHPHAEPL